MRRRILNRTVVVKRRRRILTSTYGCQNRALNCHTHTSPQRFEHVVSMPMSHAVRPPCDKEFARSALRHCWVRAPRRVQFVPAKALECLRSSCCGFVSGKQTQTNTQMLARDLSLGSERRACLTLVRACACPCARVPVQVHVPATALRLLSRELHAGPLKSSADPA
jgi:hypothetical protein